MAREEREAARRWVNEQDDPLLSKALDHIDRQEKEIAALRERLEKVEGNVAAWERWAINGGEQP